MIYELVNDCIESETERGIEKTTLKELRRYLHEFADYCQQIPITVEKISSDFMRRYVQYRGKGRGPNLVKAVVWSLRKFGAYLVLRNILPENPASPLRHLKMSPRSQSVGTTLCKRPNVSRRDVLGMSANYNKLVFFVMLFDYLRTSPWIKILFLSIPLPIM